MEMISLNVRHSAVGAMMFLVEADGKKLVYTGDFNDIAPSYLSLLGKINVLLCEGTNIAMRNGMTESDVVREAAQIMSETKGQVFVLCSTTNVQRIRHIERACRQSGRTIAIDPFAKAVSNMKNLTFLVRQTMGEFLKRLNKLTPLAGSTLIYSMWRGYENKPQTQQFLDLCTSMGMRIEYLHASGHACREMLEDSQILEY